MTMLLSGLEGVIHRDSDLGKHLRCMERAGQGISCAVTFHANPVMGLMIIMVDEKCPDSEMEQMEI